jgi:hypothetical protein
MRRNQKPRLAVGGEIFPCVTVFVEPRHIEHQLIEGMCLGIASVFHCGFDALSVNVSGRRNLRETAAPTAGRYAGPDGCCLNDRAGVGFHKRAVWPQSRSGLTGN